MLAHYVVDARAAWSAWEVEPLTFAAAASVLGLYAVGLVAAQGRAVGRARAASFAGGVVLAVLAVASPLHAAAEVTFSGHMAQHLVLLLVAAPLVVAGRPGLVIALAMPPGLRRVGWSAARAPAVALIVRRLRDPLMILLIYAAALWIWHLPGPYQAAVGSSAFHALEHATFLGVAMAFWAGVTRTGPRRRIRSVPAMLLVLGTMLQSTWLAAILTFGGLVYPLYEQRAPAWGLEAVVDQQVAGSIMWIPSSITFMVVFAVLFVRWLRDLDRLHARTPAEVARP